MRDSDRIKIQGMGIKQTEHDVCIRFGEFFFIWRMTSARAGRRRRRKKRFTSAPCCSRRTGCVNFKLLAALKSRFFPGLALF